MIAVKIRQEITAAISNATLYTKGKNLGQLRAAFDGMWMQICHSLFERRPTNRTMARKLLNDEMDLEHPKATRDLIQALHDALRSSEHTLFRKDYTDHSSSIETFILGELREIIRCLP